METFAAIALSALVLAALVLFGIGKTRNQWTATTLSYASLSVALGFVLSFIKLFEMPQAAL